MMVFSNGVHNRAGRWNRIARLFRRAISPAALATMAVSGVLALASCNVLGVLGQTGAGGRDSGSPSIGQISLSVTDTPVDGAQKVVVAFTGVDLKGPNGIVANHFATEKTVDLLTLQGDASAQLLNALAVEAGDYQWIRLDVDLANSYIELDNGKQYPLNVPSETGLKLVSGFTVAHGSNTAFVIDFDLRRSLTMTTTGKTAQITYILEPALRLTDEQQVGKISGYADANLEIGGTPISAAACSPAVYVYEGTGIIPEGYSVTVTGGTPPLTSANLTLDSTTGKLDYTVAFLAPGTYSLAATCAANDTSGASTLAFSAVKTATVTAGSTSTVNFPAPVMYTVTYNGNGATGGTVPVDSGHYQQGATVTVLGNTGGLVKSATTFTGWNTASDGSGTSYAAGASFPMGSADVTLYAEWAVYLYTANEHSASVSAFSIGTDGALGSVGDASTGANSTPYVVAISPNGEFLYTTSIGDNTVSYFSIGTDGVLSSLLGTVSTGALPFGIAINPNGGFLYTTNYGGDSVSAYSVGSDGSLQKVGNPVGTGAGPYGIAISPNGDFLYTANYLDNSVSAFPIASDGTLGSMSVVSAGVNSAPYGVAISPNGEFLYTSNIGDNTVSYFSIGSGGTLSSVLGTISTGSGPYGIAISPNGKFLYTANSLSHTVWAFSIASNGALQEIGTPINTGTGPFGIAISPNGKFLYTTNAGGDTVSAFSIGSNGSPSPINATSTTFPTGKTPLGIAITP